MQGFFVAISARGTGTWHIHKFFKAELPLGGINNTFGAGVFFTAASHKFRIWEAAVKKTPAPKEFVISPRGKSPLKNLCTCHVPVPLAEMATKKPCIKWRTKVTFCVFILMGDLVFVFDGVATDFKSENNALKFFDFSIDLIREVKHPSRWELNKGKSSYPQGVAVVQMLKAAQIYLNP